jgi:hypothetical protein
MLISTLIRLGEQNLIMTMDLGAKGIKWKAVTKSEAKKCVSLELSRAAVETTPARRLTLPRGQEC